MQEYEKCFILPEKDMHLKNVDPFVARFMKRVEERNAEVQQALQSGIDIEDDAEYNDHSTQQELSP